MEQYTVGQTILEQMGGAGMVRTMIGGTPLLMDNGLQIDFKGCRKANKVRIVLMADDTYTVTFYKFSRKTLDCPAVKGFELVYADQLVNVFEQFTGLTLRL